jgi:hypothetical protein
MCCGMVYCKIQSVNGFYGFQGSQIDREEEKDVVIECITTGEALAPKCSSA